MLDNDSEDFVDEVNKLQRLVGCENGSRHNLQHGLDVPHDRFDLEDAETTMELAENIVNRISKKYQLE